MLFKVKKVFVINKFCPWTLKLDKSRFNEIFETPLTQTDKKLSWIGDGSFDFCCNLEKRINDFSVVKIEMGWEPDGFPMWDSGRLFDFGTLYKIWEERTNNYLSFSSAHWGKQEQSYLTWNDITRYGDEVWRYSKKN